MVEIKFNHVNVDKSIGMLENLLLDCRKVRDSINNKSHEEGDPSPSVAEFYRQANEKMGVVQGRIDTLKAMKRRILELNQNGVGTSHVNGDIVIEGVPDSVENAGYAGFETWSRGVLDSKLLVKYSEEGCTPAQYDALLARMKQYQSDPSYAVAVFDEIGPGRLLDLPLDIQSNFASSSSREAAGNTRDAESELATVLGHLLATRSQGWDDNEAKNYADRLAFYAEEKNKGARIESLNKILSASRQQDVDGDGSKETIGLDYNDAFVLELANKLENFKPKGGFDGRQSALDKANALQGVVHAMTGNPDAALKWVAPQTSDGKVNAESVADRTRRLIGKSAVGDNPWTNDWAILSEVISDNGTSGTRSSSDKDGERSAAAVSGILNAVGESDDKLALSQTARMMFSKTLQRYPAGVADSAKIGNSGLYTGKTENGAQPFLSDLALSNLLGQIGQDDRSMTPLIASQTAYNNQQIAQQVEACKATGEYTPLAAVLNKQAQTNGFFAGAIARTSKQINADADARTNAYIDTAAAAIQAIPVVSNVGKVAEASHSFLKAQSINAGKVSVKKALADAEASANSQNDHDYAEGYYENEVTTTMALLKSGLYTKDELKRMRADAEFPETVGTVVDENGNLTLSSSPSAEQYDGVARLSNQLPNGAKPGLGPVTSVDTEYTKAHDTAASGSPAPRKHK